MRLPQAFVLVYSLGVGVNSVAEGDAAGVAVVDSKDAAEPEAADLAYVKEHLKAYLNPTSMLFLEGGRVQLTFELIEKDPALENVFTPRISRKVNHPFRWTVLREEKGGRFVKREVPTGGIKIGQKGFALINCWFRDDLFVEIDYLQGPNHQGRQSMALVFHDDKSRHSVGNNFGTQCVLFKGGRRAASSGKIEPPRSNVATPLKLAVKDGTFEVYKDGVLRSSAKYSQKHLRSGRVGLLWSGGVAGIVERLRVQGELDVPAMAKFLRRLK